MRENYMSAMHGETLRPERSATDEGYDVTLIERVVADADRFQNDVEAFCRLLALDVVLVNVAGTRLVGRETVRTAMEAALRTPLADVVTRSEVAQVTFLRPDVAVMSGTKIVLVREGDSLAESFRARLTFVLVKGNERWQIAVVQSTPIRGEAAGAESAPRPGAPSSHAGGGLSGARAVALPGGFGLLPPTAAPE
jgi:uncharacterized protein (TIGR02246 family)